MSSKTKGKIKYLTVSDIHFLHTSNETLYICDSFFHYFDGYSSKSRFIDLDIIFIAGDIFDINRDSKNPDLILVLNWFRSLASFCMNFGIKLRVLEGTPGHDYRQPRLFDAVAKAMGSGLDYRYIDVLEIEIMRDLDLSILYIPDEWKKSAAKAQEDVIEAMSHSGLDFIDIGIMHGMFDFQIPELGEHHPLKHDSRWYLEHISGFINIGHDHKFKTMDRILVQGSFDRISHGEEGKKGGIVCTLDPVNGNSFEFIENKRARVFKTIVVKNKELDSILKQVNKVLSNIPEDSHVRFSSAPGNPVFTLLDEFKKSYPRMTFKKHHDKKQLAEHKSALEETISLTSTYVSISLTKETIVQTTLDSLVGLSSEELSILKTEMESLL